MSFQIEDVLARWRCPAVPEAIRRQAVAPGVVGIEAHAFSQTSLNRKQHPWYDACLRSCTHPRNVKCPSPGEGRSTFSSRRVFTEPVQAAGRSGRAWL